MIEAYLDGRCSREALLEELGPAIAAEVDQQREALRRDVEWGLSGG